MNLHELLPWNGPRLAVFVLSSKNAGAGTNICHQLVDSYSRSVLRIWTFKWKFPSWNDIRCMSP